VKRYKVLKQKLKSTKGEFFIYRFLSRMCKKAYNVALANIKKNYELNKTYIDKYDNYEMVKDNEVSLWLNSEVVQKTTFSANEAYESYFKLLKYQKDNNLEITAKEPGYIKGYYPITFSYLGKKMEKGKRIFNIPLSVPFKQFLREIAPDIKILKKYINPSMFELPDEYFIRLSIPRYLTNKKIKEVSIIPLYNGKKFEIAYTYLDEEEIKESKGDTTLAIDLGVNNLATCVTTKGNSFIIDGKRLKSMNQYYNKKMAKLRSENQYVLRKNKNPLTGELIYLKDLRKNLSENESYKNIMTKRMIHLMEKRDNKIKCYFYKSSKMIINYCLENNINRIVIGKSEDFQNKGFVVSKEYFAKDNYSKHIEKEMIKKNNQNFLMIPLGKLINRIEYLCSKNGIECIIQEESYTSASSFFDLDYLPIYSKGKNKEYTFSGERIKRGLYKTKEGKCINADINGALNIYRKSSVCDINTIEYLLRRGVNTPKRLQVI
jgi:IS605 OrfB family transposase